MIRRMLGILLLALPLASGAQQQPYPTKPIRVVVPFGPGGVADITARVVAPKLSESLGQQVVIENKPGAGGIAAGREVANAPADGHTLLLISNGTAVSKALFKALPYEPTQFSMVSTLGFFPLVILADPRSPLKSLQQLIAEAKKNPGKLNAGTIGVGSTQNLAAQLFKSTTGVDLQIIPYKNTGEVLAAAKSGDVQVIFEILAPVMSHIRSGSLRPLAITTAKRFAGLPDVPTAAEQGVKDFDVASWNGLAGPPDTPRPVVERLHQEVVKALAAPDVQRRFADLGVEPRSSTPGELREFFNAETARWARVVENAKIPKQ